MVENTTSFGLEKYEIIEERDIQYGFTKLYRIRALKDFADVKKGDIGGYVEHKGNLSQYGDCWIYDNAIVLGNARVEGNATVRNYGIVEDHARICGHSSVSELAMVRDNVTVDGFVEIKGNTLVLGNIRLYGDAVIRDMLDYIVFKNWWSSGRFFTWTRSNNMWSVGCFYGTGEELIAKAYKDSELSGREYERIVKYVESIIKEY